MSPDRREDGSPGIVEVVPVLVVVAVVLGPAVGVAGAVAVGTPQSGGPVDGTDAGVAQESSPDVCDRSAEGLVESYNDNIGDVPSLVQDRVSNSRVHVRVDGASGGDYAVDTDSQGRVDGYSEGEPESPKLRVVTDCEAFRAMASADDPTEAFWREYRAGNIDFQGIGLVDGIVVDGVELVASFGDWISRVTGLGFGEAVASAGVIIVLTLLVVVPLFTYLVYRRIWMIRNKRRRRRRQREEMAGGDGDEGDGGEGGED